MFAFCIKIISEILALELTENSFQHCTLLFRTVHFLFACFITNYLHLTTPVLIPTLTILTVLKAALYQKLFWSHGRLDLLHFPCPDNQLSYQKKKKNWVSLEWSDFGEPKMCFIPFSICFLSQLLTESYIGHDTHLN